MSADESQGRRFAVQPADAARTLDRPRGVGSAHPRRVLTFDAADLARASELLARRVLARFRPDLVIGIRTGGAVVADAMRAALPEAVRILPIRKQRPSTPPKGRPAWRKRLLRALPYAVTDLLRLEEHRRLMRAFEASPTRGRIGAFTPDPIEAAPVEAALAAPGLRRVLVVDDAVDSGATMTAVVGYLSRRAPEAEIRTAAIVTTHFAPLIRPDFVLHQGVLIRFPWADDHKGTSR